MDVWYLKGCGSWWFFVLRRSTSKRKTKSSGCVNSTMLTVQEKSKLRHRLLWFQKVGESFQSGGSFG